MFGMSPAMTGAVIGLALGVMNFIILRIVADRTTDKAKPATVERQGGTGAVLKIAAIGDLIIFPIAGYAIGYFFFTPAI